jgi:DNA-binding response OmpR family regulator
MIKTKILLIEDEENLGDTLKDFLVAKGFFCDWACSAKEARSLFTNHYDIILMDIGLPDGDGLSLAKEFRVQKKDIVLLFLSALNDPSTKFEALEMGAHDYITKPFDVRELLLRLERIINQQTKNTSYQEQINFEDLKIFFSRFEVQTPQGETIELSQKECAILEMLFSNLNNVVSRNDIIQNVWGENTFPSNRTVDNYIVRLRKWIDSSKSEKVQIKTIRGIGYKLEHKE